MALSSMLAFSACVTSQKVEPGLVPSEPVSTSGAFGGEGNAVVGSPEDYVLRPADVLRVTVFREPELSQEAVAIASDGQVSFPLVGTLAVAGMTRSGLEQLLEARLGQRFLRNPDVTVNVVEYASHRVTVEGAVEQAGIYTFQPGTRLSGGVAMARGVTRVAALRDIAVFRSTAQGMEVAKFDLAAVRAGTMADPVLQPGDRIVVGTNNLAQFWQDLLRALPAFGLFTQI